MSTEQMLRDTIDQLGRRFEEFKAANDAAIKSGVKDALAEAKIDALNASVSALVEQKDTLEKRIKDEADLREGLERKVNKLRLGNKADDGIDPVAETKSFNDYRRSFSNNPVVPMSTEEYAQYKSAFFKVLRDGNERNLDEFERKALTAGTDSEGGYLLPAATVGRVVARIFELSPIRQVANVQAISTSAFEGLYDNDEASYGWVGEQGARSETNTPALGKYRIEPFEMYAAPKATQTLLDDAAVDVESWLAAKVADKFARVEGSAFINGTGVGQPRGFATYTTAATADGSRTWGEIEHVVTGANGNFHTTTADPLFDLIAAFKSAYLQRAQWVTTREVIGKIRKFKGAASGDYVWQPGLQAGQPQQILGYPVVNAQDVPALATGSLSMWLGDWMEAYQIIDRMGVRTLRDPYTSKPYVIFYSTKRVGGQVLNFEALKAIKFST